MKPKPKLILLGGCVAVGKSTIAERYLADHALTLAINRDAVMSMMGQWLTHEDEARPYVYELVKVMIATHLRSGRDVLLPYLLLDAKEAEAFEAIAHENGAAFVELFLEVSGEDEAVQIALDRGVWGEGADPITAESIPIVRELYRRMEEALNARPKTVRVPAPRGEIDKTYNAFLHEIETNG